MMTIMRLQRLRQPRSNRTTNLLLAITVLVFALIADTAVDQQDRQIVNGESGDRIQLELVQSLVPRFLF